MKTIIRHGHDGFLIENDPHRLLDTILECRQDRDRLEAMGRRGWQKIQERFNWPRVVDETLEVLSR
jgi:glycosyltransferase involved in cell wall biosynthesis